MNSSASIAGITLGLIAGTTAAVYLGININAQPKSIAESQESTESLYKGKFGEDFKYHLVSGNSEDNDWWWKRQFEKVFKNASDDKKEDEFKNEKVDDFEKLKLACVATYSKNSNKDIHGKNKTKYEKGIWMFCSRLGSRPILLSEIKNEGSKDDGSKSTDTDKIGKKHDGKLVSVKDERNYKFWELQQQSFLNQEEPTPDSDFKKLHKKLNNSESDVETDFSSLKEVCASYYKSENSNETIRRLTIKHCSLKVLEK